MLLASRRQMKGGTRAQHPTADHDNLSLTRNVHVSWHGDSPFGRFECSQTL
jgi:hypothetical protein